MLPEAGWSTDAGDLPWTSLELPLPESIAISIASDSTKVIDATFDGEGSFNGGIFLDAAAVDTKLKDWAMDWRKKVVLAMEGVKWRR